MPLGMGRGQNVGLRNLCRISTLLPPGESVFHKHMSSFSLYKHDVHKMLYFQVGTRIPMATMVMMAIPSVPLVTGSPTVRHLPPVMSSAAA